MERIKQALERARKDRVGLFGPKLKFAAVPPPKAEVDEADITYTQTTVLSVSHRALRENRVITGADAEDATMAYKMLRTQVLQRMNANKWNSLAITSAGPGQGKTLTAVNLALSIAREVHCTVLLVDLDLRNPGVHRYFNLKPKYGVPDYYYDDIPLADILVNPGIERLVVLPGREPQFNSSEMLNAPRMKQLVQELKTRYPSRIVLFDLPPLLVADDALAFSPLVDCALLVVEDAKTSKEELRTAKEMLRGTHIIGSVLNKSTEPMSAYY